MQIPGFDEFITQYPVFEYRILETSEISVQERVRIVCEKECERYGTTWACPPGTGSLRECQERIHSYRHGLFFSSVAEVSDLFNMEEMLSTRKEHEKLTEEIRDYMKKQGLDCFILSTESCDICPTCTYPDSPCRYPEKMHPCLESHGVVVMELTEQQQMEYSLGGNSILWFSLILFRPLQKEEE